MRLCKIDKRLKETKCFANNIDILLYWRRKGLKIRFQKCFSYLFESLAVEKDSKD